MARALLTKLKLVDKLRDGPSCDLYFPEEQNWSEIELWHQIDIVFSEHSCPMNGDVVIAEKGTSIRLEMFH